MISTARPPAPARARLTRWSLLGDEALARLAAGGSEAAFTVLYQRYHGPLLGYCRSILLDAEDAHDAAQSALESALRGLAGRDQQRPLKPWLYRIAHNEAVSILRRRRPQVALHPALESDGPGPEDDAETRRRLVELIADLRALPERQRGALVMRELNGLAYEEIGSALQMSPVAARRAVFDARTALQDCATGHDETCAAVQRSLSDGDRRTLRRRPIRAHLRGCRSCTAFERAIRARRGDLLSLAPWLPGAALLGAGTGGGLVAGAGTVGAGGSSVGAIGGAWATLPAAAKALTAAAVIAGAGTAGLELQSPAGHSPGRTPSTHPAQHRHHVASAASELGSPQGTPAAGHARTPSHHHAPAASKLRPTAARPQGRGLLVSVGTASTSSPSGSTRSLGQAHIRPLPTSTSPRTGPLADAAPKPAAQRPASPGHRVSGQRRADGAPDARERFELLLREQAQRLRQALADAHGDGTLASAAELQDARSDVRRTVVQAQAASVLAPVLEQTVTGVRTLLDDAQGLLGQLLGGRG